MCKCILSAPQIKILKNLVTNQQVALLRKSTTNITQQAKNELKDKMEDLHDLSFALEAQETIVKGESLLGDPR